MKLAGAKVDRMNPQAALRKQIERYRAMTGEQRLKVAFDLHEFACQVARAGIRRQHPKAGTDQVEQYLRERVALSHRL